MLSIHRLISRYLIHLVETCLSLERNSVARHVVNTLFFSSLSPSLSPSFLPSFPLAPFLPLTLQSRSILEYKVPGELTRRRTNGALSGVITGRRDEGTSARETREAMTEGEFRSSSQKRRRSSSGTRRGSITVSAARVFSGDTHAALSPAPVVPRAERKGVRQAGR